MRHIPDEELHAYLDQALSRSQCVEIECHLAGCVRCRHERDQIAALRDRTTALLGLVAPAHRARPTFATLAALAQARRADRDAPASRAASIRSERWSRQGTRAAGIMLLLAAGWAARGMVPAPGTPNPSTLEQLVLGPSLDQFGARQPAFSSIVPATGAPNRAPSPVPATEPDPAWRPDPIERAPRRVAPSAAAEVAPLALTVSTLDAADAGADFPATGVWRTVSWDEAAALTGDAIPRIAGLPVIEIQVQRVGAEERPMVMVVHQDAAGRLVRSIEGPVDRLGDLLSEVIARTEGAIRTSQPQRTASDYVGAATGSPRRTIRVMTLAGRLEADSLNLLSRQVATR